MVSALVEVFIKLPGSTEDVKIMVPENGAVAGDGITEEVTFAELCRLREKSAWLGPSRHLINTM